MPTCVEIQLHNYGEICTKTILVYEIQKFMSVGSILHYNLARRFSVLPATDADVDCLDVSCLQLNIQKLDTYSGLI